MAMMSPISPDTDEHLPRRRSVRSRDTLLAALLWGYTALIAAWFVGGWGGVPTLQRVADWQPLPSQLVAMFLVWPVLRELEPGPRRTAWLLIGLATLSDVIATLGWIVGSRFGWFAEFNWSQLPYLAYYPLMCAAFVMFFRSLGGNFRSAFVRIEIVVLACGVAVPIWLLQIRPVVASRGWHDADVVYSVAFCAGDGLMLVLMSMMTTRIVEWRAGRPLLLMALAVFTTFVSDLAWVGSDTRSYKLDAWSNAGAFGLYYALVGTALALEQHSRVSSGVRVIESSRHGVLPLLALLVAAGLLCVQDVEFWHARGIVLLAFTLIAALLVVARQFSVRLQIDSLQAELTRQVAQTQLTELMRQSRDLVVVADADLRLSYASPSSNRVLGIDPGLLVRRHATQVLGGEHESRMRDFLGQLMLQDEARADLELQVRNTGGERRSVKVFGSNQLHNPLIAGLVLTIRDVSGRRRLERELVEIAVLERARLAADVRDTLGTELEMIRHQLHDLRLREVCGNRVSGNDVAAVIAQVNHGIDTARRISMSLSPLNVARGALDVALRTLCSEFSRRFRVQIDMDMNLAGQGIATQDADHVFRIVEQIFSSIVRHCGLKLQLTIHSIPEQLNLLVEGSFDVPGEPYHSMGLRLAEYRIHVLGGTMQNELRDGRCRVEARIPLSC